MKMKKFICIVLAAVILTTTCVSNTAYAKTKDVTQKFSDKKKVVKLCNTLCNYIGYQDAYVMKTGNTQVLKFSKQSDRRKVLPYCKPNKMKVNMKKISRQMFGKNTSTKGLEHLTGDWGAQWPTLKFKKIYKLNAKNYRLNFKLVWLCDELDTKDTTGNITIWVKKSSAAPYGYYIKKLKIKKTADF